MKNIFAPIAEKKRCELCMEPATTECGNGTPLCEPCMDKMRFVDVEGHIIYGNATVH